MRIFIILFCQVCFCLLFSSNCFAFKKLITKTKDSEISSVVSETRSYISNGKISKFVIIGKTEDKKNIKNICIVENIDNEALIKSIVFDKNDESCVYCTDIRSHRKAHYIDFKFNTNGTFFQIKNCK